MCVVRQQLNQRVTDILINCNMVPIKHIRKLIFDQLSGDSLKKYFFYVVRICNIQCFRFFTVIFHFNEEKYTQFLKLPIFRVSRDIFRLCARILIGNYI